MLRAKGVLFVSNLFSVGDTYGAVCKELAIKLTKLCRKVSITSASTIRILRPLDMIVTIWSKRRDYSVAHIDVFSGSAFRWAEASAFVLKRLRKPFILTLHGGNLPVFSATYSNRVKSLLSSAQSVTTPSRYLLEAMQPYRSDILLIPNPIDIQKYSFRLRSKVLPKILYLRALHKVYNPMLAVDVINSVRRSHPETTLTIAGPDKGDGSLKSVRIAIQRYRLTDQVKTVGAISKKDIPATMSKSDIFINTTNVDNTPISVIEAMACGLCIVSTNVGGIPYLLEHDLDALLVPPNDPEAMAQAVRRILTEPGLAERLSRNARSKAEQFDWSVILPQWESLLTDVIERHKQGQR